jgi:hypothetical protein
VPNLKMASITVMPKMKTAQSVLHAFARLFSLILVTSRIAGYRSLDSSIFMKIASWTEVFFALKRKRWIEAAMILLMFPKFRLPFARNDADQVSLAEHVFRYIVHGRSDLKLGKFIASSLLRRTDNYNISP